jgi:hypothetical protein
MPSGWQYNSQLPYRPVAVCTADTPTAMPPSKGSKTLLSSEAAGSNGFLGCFKCSHW